MFKDVFEEFLGLVEKSTGRSRKELGFRPPVSPNFRWHSANSSQTGIEAKKMHGLATKTAALP